MKGHLESAENYIQELPGTLSQGALALVEQIIANLSDVNDMLPQHVVNESSKAADKVHHYDNYR